jgi:uncharacterized protein
MSYLADDIVWIVADNSPLADRSPYHGIAEVRSGVFERLTADFDKLVFDADEIFECNGGERVVALGYYYFRFHGQAEERKAQVAHVWTIRDGRAVKFQQYLDTLQVARDAGAVQGSRPSYLSGTRNNYLHARSDEGLTNRWSQPLARHDAVIRVYDEAGDIFNAHCF